MKRLNPGVAGLLLCVAGIGCSSYNVRSLPSITPANAPVRLKTEDVSIGAKAFTDSTEIKAIFNYDLLSKGILPVFVTVENTGSTDVEIQRPRVQFTTPGGQVLDVITADTATGGQGRNAMGEAIFLFGIFSYDNANKFNEELKRDWADKSYGELVVLTPGRTVGKFFYFNVGTSFTVSGSKLNIVYSAGNVRKTATLQF
jgi:hypothetical protein